VSEWWKEYDRRLGIGCGCLVIFTVILVVILVVAMAAVPGDVSYLATPTPGG